MIFRRSMHIIVCLFVILLLWIWSGIKQSVSVNQQEVVVDLQLIAVVADETTLCTVPTLFTLWMHLLLPAV